jgi:Fe-Mn family superoxide dismutase
MKLHHSKHHQTYVNSLNAALSSQASLTAAGDIPATIYQQSLISFHGGGHINHTLFWANLSPASSPSTNESAAPNLNKALRTTYGSVENFRTKFNTVLLGIQGSGWGWLVQDVETGNLDIVTTKDQGIVPKGKKPLFGIDMWEHAYYLQYLNDKTSYINGVWNILNWKVIEERFNGDIKSVFGTLDALNASI